MVCSDSKSHCINLIILLKSATEMLICFHKFDRRLLFLFHKKFKYHVCDYFGTTAYDQQVLA